MSDAAAVLAPAADGEPDRLKRVMITVAVMLATTVIIMDMNIASIALPHMQGGLSANQDQISWVMTIYFMMQATTMSATGWLAGRLGRKRLFIGTLIGFTICSMLSGSADSIPEIMFYRGLQGMFSAAVVPISQALMLDTYPKERHPQALAIWGMGVMFAPVMGPVIGGWLTDEYSWRWVFYVSMPFAVLAIIGAMIFIRETPRNRERKFDWFGFICIGLSLAGLQFMLDRGEGEGWFDSDFILLNAAIVCIAFYLFITHSLTTDNPFISRGIFADRNFVLGLLFMFLLGALVLSMNVIMPLFLQNSRGFPILTAALVMMPRGLGTMFGLTLAGRIANIVDPRVVIVFGFGCVAYSAWLLSTFTTDVGLGDFVIAGFFNGIGIGAIWVPLTTVSFWTLPVQYRTEASTLTSLFRNYGSGIGVSVVISVLTRSQSTAHSHMTEHVNPYAESLQAPGVPSQWDILTNDGLMALQSEISRQALSIGFLNDFNLIFYGAMISIPLVILMARGQAPKTKVE
ncbi:MAG: DHA2 family efflux MFS transporter permease subunit [Rhodospirillaceae bacterium]|nr:DHA2 family efflux MFS transporter permease subunit [Rhodospirillaceae bacterium]MBT5458139.1 DHA2 family efflux MFS transporter permease subunit [Rhodospirillaceae bacterium]